MTSIDLTPYRDRYRAALLDDTLPFWLPRAIDRDHGGFLVMRDRDGRVLDESLDEALLTDDGKVLYPVANGIPVLLEGEAINMEQLG